MAQYLILIYETEASYAEGGADVWAEVGKAHTRFAEQVGELGATMVGGNALQPTMTATSIRNDVVTDGPFAETKEQLGGYYMLERKDLDGEHYLWRINCEFGPTADAIPTRERRSIRRPTVATMRATPCCSARTSCAPPQSPATRTPRQSPGPDLSGSVWWVWSPSSSPPRWAKRSPRSRRYC